jgi:hypothetical protein
MQFSNNRFAKDELLGEHLGDGSLPRRLWEKRMDLSEDIRLKIEASTYKETFLDVVNRLQSEGVVITHDVLAAIQATIDLTRDMTE